MDFPGEGWFLTIKRPPPPRGEVVLSFFWVHLVASRSFESMVIRAFSFSDPRSGIFPCKKNALNFH